MGHKKGGKSSGYQSKGTVGTRKLGHTADSILRSMLACLFDNKGFPRKNNKTYDRKQTPKKENEHTAELRRNKKKRFRSK
jgi:hypothetical protein